MILDTILADTRTRLAQRKQTHPEAALREQASAAPAPLNMLDALGGPGVAIIAEVKRASPSKGTLNSTLQTASLVREYAQAGADAISVLTEPSFFHGDLQDLMDARRSLTEAGLPRPILRKDFIVDPYQLLEARAAGADAVLLIAAALDSSELPMLFDRALELQLTPLVEIHDEVDLARVLPLRPPLIGINNRNLRDFSVNLEVTERLRPLIPPSSLVVSESGVNRAEDVRRLAEAGVAAVLVGEALVKASNVGALLRQLKEGGAVPVVKVCGLTNLEDARSAWHSGADPLGFVFVPASARCITLHTAASITGALRAEGCRVSFVGVFANQGVAFIEEAVAAAGLHVVQLHGDEDPPFARALPVFSIIARRVRESVPWTRLAQYDAWAYLLDGYSPGSLGGTGQTWNLDLLADRPPAARLIVAGGLTPENVAHVIKKARPWGVDVSSGVERAPGRKDPDKVARFIAEARAAYKDIDRIDGIDGSVR